MAHKVETRNVEAEETTAYPSSREPGDELGYQPQASGPVDPGELKPPRGDTAIVPPDKEVQKQGKP